MTPRGRPRVRSSSNWSAPTRFYVYESVYDRFVSDFAQRADALRIGNGIDPDTQMGPMIAERRLAAMSDLMEDATR